MEKSRIHWLDCTKGVLIILMVLGHLTLIGVNSSGFTLTKNAIYTFHMPLFFAVSGILFGMFDWNRQPGTVITHKLVTLGLPYLFFDLAYVVLNSILQHYISVNSVVELSRGLQFWFYPAAHYWFLHALILYFLIAALTKQNKTLYWVTLLLSVGLFLSGKDVLNLSGYYSFALGGLVGRMLSEQPPGKAVRIALPLGTFVYLGLLIPWLFLSVPCRQIYKLLLQLTGSLACVSLTLVLMRCNPVQSFLSYVGRNCWYIYLLHSYFTMLNKLLSGRLVLGLWPQLVLGMLLGVGGPLAVGAIVRRVPLFRFFFEPGPFLLKKKSRKEG